MISLSVVLFLVTSTACFSLRRENLGGKWYLDQIDGAHKGLPAQVPGGIYTDLQWNKIIEDPIYEENDQKTHWVGRTNWLYYKNFTADKDLLDFKNIHLIFEGLDTIALITLNDEFIGNCSNMFVRYTYDIRDKLKLGENKLEVYFVSPVNEAKRLAEEQSKTYTVPPDCPPNDYNGECHINQLRKMQASFSWDWGPALASVGIWKDVYLEAFNTNSIRNVLVEYEDISADDIWNVSVTTYFSKNIMNNASGRLLLELETDYETKLKIITDVNASVDRFDEIKVLQTFQLPQNSVKRWWPNGYGEQPLYNLTVTFASGDEQDSKSQKIGFRTVDLVQDELGLGTNGMYFYFKVNGLPIFVKGSNAIPISILPEKGQDTKSVDYLMKSVYDSNMNMLRVWGGGVYESDYYYQRADELGIMLWQDFMFACALYPTTKNFLGNVTTEVSHQVKRLGSHPSIVIWAGNNENEAALTGNWYGSNGKEIYNEDYKRLYFHTVKTEFTRILKNGLFVGSSPSNGKKTEEDGGISSNPYDQLYGDLHTYIYELDSFNPNIYPTPRLSSEYGFQSYPAPSTLRKASNDTSNLVIGSDFLSHRQHHPFGDIQIKLLISYQLELPPKTSQNYTNVFIFYSQVIQAVSVKTETEHYRKYRSLVTEDGKGFTMGALYWQLNDVWIAPTWSGIDWTGKWKMLQYFIRDAFAPVSVVGHLTQDKSLEITVISDQTSSLEDIQLSLSVYNFKSFVCANESLQNIKKVEAGSSKNVLTIKTDEYLGQVGCGSLSEATKNCFFHLQLLKNGEVIAPDNFVFAKSLKNLALVQPRIQISSVEAIKNDDNRNFKIVVKSSDIALFVWLEALEISGRFSENGFHQINETRTIYYQCNENTTAENLLKRLHISNILNVDEF